MNRSSSRPVPATLRVAAAQMNSTSSVERNIAKITAMIRAARRRRAGALLLPECALTSYLAHPAAIGRTRVSEGLREISRLAAEHQIAVLVGSPLWVGRRIHNCLVVFAADGRAIHAYAKCQLTPGDRAVYSPGNAVSLFELGGVPATAIICHERRYPELVRLPVMMGARVLFHPNAGLDALRVSRTKRNGRDGAVPRAFENAIFYVFANTVGPQDNGKWSAGDTKIVAPDTTRLDWIGNREEGLAVATLNLALATGRYAADSRQQPRFMAPFWRGMIRAAQVRQRTDNARLLGALK
ncbi:MAG: carbon-nitrogen hydrolase family protein [Verrucomicrobiales bacterium]|nr:carbon-nitrogen hydrolase family protein [Verrucomicrobiales bacterium]MCP5528416.1 carbon-nitrogen hydrolase family protein [Verrucomicrobiales bacterium]